MTAQFLHWMSTPSREQLLPLLAAVLGGLICFFFMEWRIIRCKRKHQELALRYAALEERLISEHKHGQEKLDLLEQSRQEMKHQFKNLAQEIFDEKTTTFSRQSSDKMESLLQPFREQIVAFRGRIETIFLEETREHASLKQEIVHLRELNRQINQEAINLTRAISGDRKLQGSWGELVLEKILERSGLRKGTEYETQTGLRDGDNKLFKPDVIIHLPDEKDIVIDSKVSLSAWSRFVAAEDESERETAMSEHIQALYNHLKSLGAKDYSSLQGLRSLDFVLMFIPIDAAFMTAIQVKEELFTEMYSQKVIIVTPTTLLATLRTVEYFWQLEKQNINALEIAERAGLLYDKLRGFLEDMEKLGRQIDACKDSYDNAINKMSQGRGNLLSQASKFPELGVKVKAPFPLKLVREKDEESL